jgi:hypothetical protein
MKMLEFGKKIHNNNVKLKKEVEKGLKFHGWVMGHGWGLQGEHGRWVHGVET